MKILQLKFQNLNALYGSWSIDFTHSEYVSDGIFALVGPTGAGKSTILDAICLALYGATPRLGKITSSNEIMSRQSGECYAEVVFEAQNKKYRCFWGQHRAHKKHDGNLSEAKHEISDADTGHIIESKKNKVLTFVEQVTGLDFERFTRSILLAQGDFDSFLKADQEQKSKMLEQITGTEIYSEISKQAFERKRDEQKKLEILQAETKMISVLDAEQEQVLKQELKHQQQAEIELVKKQQETKKAITWLKTIGDLKIDMSNLAEEAASLQMEIEAFQPERIKLNQAEIAAQLDGAYMTLTAIRKQLQNDQNALNAEEKALPKLELDAKQQAEILKYAEQQVVLAKEALKNAAPLIQKTRLLDQDLHRQKAIISENKEILQKEQAIIDANKQASAEQQKQRAKIQQSLEEITDYLNQNKQDEWLISNFSAIEAQVSNLQIKQQEITQKEADYQKANDDLKQAQGKLSKAIEQSQGCNQIFEKAVKDHQQGKDRLNGLLKDRLLREYRAEKEALLNEAKLLAQIKNLEDLRAKLEDGKACPLCGSKEHPFAQGNTPELDENEQKIKELTTLITAAENQENIIEKLKHMEATSRENFIQSQHQEAIAKNDTIVAEKSLTGLQANLEESRVNLAQLTQDVLRKLQPFGFSEIPDIDMLKKRKDMWQEQLKNKAEIEKQVISMDSEIQRLGAVIETRNHNASEKKNHLDALKKEYDAKKNERKTLYGDKNADDEEAQLQKNIINAENKKNDANAQYAQQQQKLNTAKTQITSLNERINQKKQELTVAESDFSTALIDANFLDEQQFLAARLPYEQKDALSNRAKYLDKKQIQLTTRQEDNNNRLKTELAKNVTAEALEKLEPEFETAEETLKQLQDTISDLKYQLKDNETAKKQIKDKQATVEKQQQEYERWDRLYRLIGSSDGKKYRNFAQGLTFKLMVTHANRQLQKMTDRYLLIQGDQQPLELNVIDAYQAGEIRSIKNLSGGESFIVSLALALGLSEMASKRAQIDSLFLDEGFGTLDEESLENALETLSSLQQNGKLIGIISHVAALKERIHTQITITPISGGKSIISGPGCNKE